MPIAKTKKIPLTPLKGGPSQNEVAAVLHVSRRGVLEAAKAIRENDLTYDAVAGMNPAAVEDTFFPKE